MKYAKTFRIGILLGIILFLMGSFMTLDWTLYFYSLASYTHPEVLYTRITKTVTSFCIALLVWSLGADGVSRQDTKKLRIVFIAMFGGDLLFLLDEFAAIFDVFAVATFAIGHLLVIWRNSQGLVPYLRADDPQHHRLRWGITTAILLVVITVVLYLVVLLPYVAGTAWALIFPIYAIVLNISLWVGWYTLRTAYFPRANTLLIAIGATSFFIGDFLVGINLAFPPGPTVLLSQYLTWLFYAPAIILIALSGYKWDLPANKLQ